MPCNKSGRSFEECKNLWSTYGLENFILQNQLFSFFFSKSLWQKNIWMQKNIVRPIGFFMYGKNYSWYHLSADTEDWLNWYCERISNKNTSWILKIITHLDVCHLKEKRSWEAHKNVKIMFEKKLDQSWTEIFLVRAFLSQVPLLVPVGIRLVNSLWFI